MTLILSLVAVVAGAWIGLKFPDVDQRTDLLLHRSIITHGPLLPLIGYMLLRGVRHPPARMFAMAVCLGFTVHLAFDLFPVGWAGYALISIPIYGWVPSGVSTLWIGAGAILCVYWAVRLVRDLTEAFAFVLVAMVAFTVAASGERTVLGPLITVVGSVLAGWMASLLQALKTGRRRSGRTVMQGWIDQISAAIRLASPAIVRRGGIWPPWSATNANGRNGLPAAGR